MTVTTTLVASLVNASAGVAMGTAINMLMPNIQEDTNPIATTAMQVGLTGVAIGVMSQSQVSQWDPSASYALFSFALMQSQLDLASRMMLMGAIARESIPGLVTGMMQPAQVAK